MVLVKGSAAMGPMIFFSFEAVSCFISQDSFDNGQCVNTSNAAMCLSGYLVILTTLSIINKAVPKSVQRETAWELSSIASLKGLKWWQQIQGGLTIITAITSLCLLSVLGVEEGENIMILFVGGLGGASIGIATLINMTMLIKTRATTEELPTEQRSTRGISAGDVEKNAFIGALI